MRKTRFRQGDRRTLMPKTAREGVIFGQRLRELRTARNLTQGELAERCGSNHPFISNLERGVKVPSLTMILRLAEALECRATDLIQVFDEGPRVSPHSREN
jgi:transcriptional regulator with XRE-family HTH domain